MDEQRRSPRQRSFKGGTISFGTYPSVDCIIRNISDTGARLEVHGAAVIPDQFMLLIKPELLKRSCRVAWRDNQSIGVQFVMKHD
jgi:hypothetical protein